MQNIIEFKNVSKRYRLGSVGSGSLQHDLQSLVAKITKKDDPNTRIGQKLRQGKFTALDNLNLTVKKGETVGIIGRNGAGKSTLLKLLSRVTAPSEGEIYLNGKVSSMLEVGTGFHPELTGRENIYLNSSILGMRKDEVDKKIDSIIEFSECGQFIDTPVKRYSSGMYVKLAFAVAVHLDSEIILMDEVLAVGDIHFQKKCIEKMRATALDDNRTILYVSHNMNTVRRLCNRCIVLEKGKKIFDGDTEEAIRIYTDSSDAPLPPKHNFEDIKREKGLGVFARLDGIEFPDREISSFEFNEEISVSLKYCCFDELGGLRARFTVLTVDGQPIGTAVSDVIEGSTGEHRADISIRFCGLLPSKYQLSLSLILTTEQKSTFIYDRINNAFGIEIVPTENSPMSAVKTNGCVIFNK